MNECGGLQRVIAPFISEEGSGQTAELRIDRLDQLSLGQAIAGSKSDKKVSYLILFGRIVRRF